MAGELAAHLFLVPVLCLVAEGLWPCSLLLAVAEPSPNGLCLLLGQFLRLKYIQGFFLGEGAPNKKGTLRAVLQVLSWSAK